MNYFGYRYEVITPKELPLEEYLLLGQLFQMIESVYQTFSKNDRLHQLTN